MDSAAHPQEQLSGIARYVDALTRFRAPNAFNPWTQQNEDDLAADGPQQRRQRLLRHLSCRSPRLLLVGEAAGYQGLRVSGVAFTSERLLCDGSIPRIEAQPRLSGRKTPWSEPSASIVWGTLYDLGLAESALLTNAFAWHPYRAGRPLSNRTPTDIELEVGLACLALLLEALPELPVVAVGRKAEAVLARMALRPFACVRHPAMGGATKFRTGMAEVAERLPPR